jgi:hypothetical protein
MRCGAVVPNRHARRSVECLRQLLERGDVVHR